MICFLILGMDEERIASHDSLCRAGVRKALIQDPLGYFTQRTIDVLTFTTHRERHPTCITPYQRERKDLAILAPQSQ